MNINQKEQNCLNKLKKTIQCDPLWAENLYVDCDDPYSEPLISWSKIGVECSYVYFLDYLITRIPEHKLSTLGTYLRSKIVIEFILQDKSKYIQHYQLKYPDDFQNEEFMKSFYHLCNSILTSENFLYIFKNSKIFDPNFVFLKTHFQQFENLITTIDKIELHNSFEEQILKREEHKKENSLKLKL